jgi:hypothetical protein
MELFLEASNLASGDTGREFMERLPTDVAGD